MDEPLGFIFLHVSNVTLWKFRLYYKAKFDSFLLHIKEVAFMDSNQGFRESINFAF